MELIRCSSKLAVLIRLTTWAVMVERMSSVTPRYLADREKRTVEFPTVRESERGVEFKILGADMISASVLSSFSFSLLWVIHDLTSWPHCTDWMSSSTCCGGADFCNWVSSAKGWWKTEWLSIKSERGAVHRMKRTGPGTDPCGTLQLMGTGAELQLFTVTVWDLFVRQEESQCSAVTSMPKTCSRCWRWMVRSIVFLLLRAQCYQRVHCLHLRRLGCSFVCHVSFLGFFSSS